MLRDVSLSRLSDENAEEARKYFEGKLARAKRREELGLPPEPLTVFRLIDDGPPPCKVTITEESRKISAAILCRLSG
ncbi:hypothetical protein J6X13_03235 [Candidatus Saccharibacteria bacterium]|nr:hypothetical protein [Candidatus Saccharibacteria bacterium]